MKKIIAELTEKYGEKFTVEYLGNKAEIYSENHLFEYSLKTGKLVQLT